MKKKKIIYNPSQVIKMQWSIPLTNLEIVLFSKSKSINPSASSESLPNLLNLISLFLEPKKKKYVKKKNV